jgi:ribosome-interacting GTPase 1
MWSLLPKHKASEKLQAELKKKISETREEVEHQHHKGKKTGLSYKVPRQGAGQFILLGAPNTGKSRLLTRLTRATPEVAAYPFTTREPHVGMMDWEDIRIQLIDTPPITADFMEGYLSSMVRSADAAVLLVDLGDDDGPFAVEGILTRLADTKTILVGKPPEKVDDYSLEYVRTILVGNKMDLAGAQDRLDVLREMYSDRFPFQVIAAENGTGLEDLRTGLYRFLNVIRVYTKKPGKPADMDSPFTCPEGSTLLELATLVHRDFADQLKSARIWGTGVFDGQTVTRDHVLHDKDIVELHG